MSIKFTDAQLLMLGAAAQREDRILAAPRNLKGVVAQKFAAKLIAARLVKEVKVKTGALSWCRDAESGQSFALKLTAAGLKASATASGAPASKAVESETQNNGATVASSTPAAQAPRAGTKISQVVGLLQRDDGTTLDEVVAATGWLPHTARAALTGLRHRGYDVRLERGEKGKASVYRAFATPAMAP